MAIASDSELLSPADAARLIGVSAKVVRRLIKDGELQARQSGRRQYISRPSVLTYLSKDTDTDGPEPSYEADDDESLDISKLQKAGINYEQQNGSIRFLYDQHINDELDIAPEFQRFYVFSPEIASALIESIYLGVPVPAMYFAEEGGKLIVIDGHQRLRTYFNFLEGKLELRNLEFLTDLNGKRWSDLTDTQQRDFTNRGVQYFLIKGDNDPSLMFSVFRRLNSGAVKLTEQELRNCIYQGEFTRMIAKLSTEDTWLRLMRYREPHKRMKDRELILRFFAVFTAQNEYQSPLKTFLSNQMKALNERSSEYLDDLRELFLNAVKLANLVFPDHAFQRFAPGDASNPNGGWQKVVNLALFEVVMVSLAKLSYREVFPRKEAIQERMLQLMTGSIEFSDTVTINAYRPLKFRRRHEIWANALRAHDSLSRL